jgi:hypothetical protein
MTDAAVQIGPGLSPEDEAAHRQHLAETYAKEAEAAVDKIEEKLAGMQQTLKDAKAEAKRLRAEAKGGRG